jgi:hypothetical protein
MILPIAASYGGLIRARCEEIVMLSGQFRGKAQQKSVSGNNAMTSCQKQVSLRDDAAHDVAG